MPATFDTFTTIHSFKIFEVIEKLLELMELDDKLDPSNVSAEFGVKQHLSEEGNFEGNYLHIGFRLDGRWSFHEIPIDFRVPEELKYSHVRMPDLSGDEVEFYDKPVKRSAFEAWQYAKTLDK